MGLCGVEDGVESGNFQCFRGKTGDKKARGAVEGTAARWEIRMVRYYGAIFFMVGTRPICGLPTGPWALLMLMTACEVLPQQSFLGQ